MLGMPTWPLIEEMLTTHLRPAPPCGHDPRWLPGFGQDTCHRMPLDLLGQQFQSITSPGHDGNPGARSRQQPRHHLPQT